MPYTRSQNKLFWLASHDPQVAKERGIPMATAKRLAQEGVKKPVPKKVKK